MKSAKILTLIILCLALVAVFASCNLIDNLQTYKGSYIPEPGQNDQSGDDEVIIEEGVDEDTDADNDATAPDEATSGTTSGDSREVVLYFASSNGKSLEAETRTIPQQEGIARATINELIAGPMDDSLLPTLPAATILDDINISGGVCTVDFSSELLDDLPDDNEAQMLALYSIVNTLSQFDSVDYVRILVNGQALDSLAGVDVSTVIAPMYW
jgi:germination protein M